MSFNEMNTIENALRDRLVGRQVAESTGIVAEESVEYVANARQIMSGEYTDTFKPPLYSLFLIPSILIDDLGSSFYVYQILVFSIGMPLSLLLYRRLRLRPRHMLIALGM